MTDNNAPSGAQTHDRAALVELIDAAKTVCDAFIMYSASPELRRLREAARALSAPAEAGEAGPCSCGDSMERQWVCETCGERRTDDGGPDPSVVAERAERGAPTWEQMAAIGNAGNREPEFRREAPKGQRPLPDRPLMGERPAQGEALNELIQLREDVRQWDFGAMTRAEAAVSVLDTLERRLRLAAAPPQESAGITASTLSAADFRLEIRRVSTGEVVDGAEAERILAAMRGSDPGRRV